MYVVSFYVLQDTYKYIYQTTYVKMKKKDNLVKKTQVVITKKIKIL